MKKAIQLIFLSGLILGPVSSVHANGGLIGSVLDIARDSVDTGLSIARDSVHAGTQIASDVVHGLTRDDRRQLSGYCRKNVNAYHRHSRENLPQDWEDEIYISRPAPEFVYQAGVMVPRSAPGLRNQPRTTVAFRIDQSVILIDSRQGVVVDIVGL